MMEILRHEQALTIRIRVDNRREGEAYNPSHPRRPHQERIRGGTTLVRHPHHDNALQ